MTEVVDSLTTRAHSSLAIVIVTFQRQELLAKLLDSIRQMGELPQAIFVVDNEAAVTTAGLVSQLELDLAQSGTAVTYAPQATNSGGAGGFSEGTRLAYMAGHQWIWLMDDDVAILPGALTHLRRWTKRVDRDLASGCDLKQTHGVIQGQRRNFDGSPFYWQYRFWTALGIPNPIAPRLFSTPDDVSRRSEGRPMNTACFEGGLFHRSVVEQIGLPDARFFIYWDDSIYGYLATTVTQPLIVSDFILQRTRTLDHYRLGRIRKLNATSDLARYHILRNRGYMAHYLKAHGDYRPFWFGLGTAATFAKEVIRLTIGGDFREGFSRLWAGWREAQLLRRDPNWQAMPPLTSGLGQDAHPEVSSDAV